jgi:hypothetical protein
MKFKGLVVAVCCLFAAPAPVHVSPDGSGLAAPRAGASVGTFDLPFLANEGQTDPRVAFYTHTFAGTVFVTKAGSIVYSHPAAGGGVALEEELVGGRRVSPAPARRTTPRISSFAGRDPSRWRRHVATYAGIDLRRPYPGIDVTLKARAHNVEKVFTIAPGADPRSIRVRVRGVRRLDVDPQGRLQAVTPAGSVAFSAPVAFQERDGHRVPVAVSYVVDSDSYTFALGAYDETAPLVIDPYLASTLIGGAGTEYPTSFAFAPDGSVVVAGVTASADFPATIGAFAAGLAGSTDAFVAKFDADLTTLQAATFYGGAAAEDTLGMALDAAGNVFLAGRTASTDLPVTPGAFQPTRKSGDEAFIAKLDPTLGTLLASSYLGGNRNDAWCCGISVNVDGAGSVFVTMLTNSTDFPTTAGAYDRTYNDFDTDDIVIAKLDNNLAALLAGTYLGGSLWDVPYGTRLDASGNLFVVGRTSSSNYPITPGAYHGDYPDAFPWYDGFISKVSNDLTTLVASTYIGSTSSLDILWDVDVAPDGSVYLVGSTASPAFPVTAGSFDTTYNGGAEDGVVIRMNASLTTVLASTFLGGAAFERTVGISLDGSGSVHVGGYTASANFPTTADALYPSYHPGGVSGYDAIYTKLDPGLSTVVTSTFIGGSGDDVAQRPVLNASGHVYLRGSTTSPDFPTTTGAYDETLNGGTDTFIMRLGPVRPPNSAPVADAGPDQTVACGTDCTASVLLDGSGSSDADGDALTFEWSGPFGTATGVSPLVTLPLGTHVVTLTIDDGNGGTASDTVTIAVVDETPPVFTSAVGPFTITSTDPDGTPFTVPLPEASDNCVTVAVGSDAPALFPIGTTTVTFTATDGAGNTASSSTTVTVVEPPPALTLDALIAKVRALPLHHGLIRSLLAKLEAASRSYARGNVTAGDNQLGAFIHEVEALGRTGRLDRGVADDLIAHAQAVIAAS